MLGRDETLSNMGDGGGIKHKIHWNWLNKNKKTDSKEEGDKDNKEVMMKAREKQQQGEH